MPYANPNVATSGGKRKTLGDMDTTSIGNPKDSELSLHSQVKLAVWLLCSTISVEGEAVGF